MNRVAVLLRVLTLALLAVAVGVPAGPAGAQNQVDTDVAYEVLSEASNEPLQVEVASDGRVIWAERDGSINVLTPQGVKVTAAELRPAASLCETCTPEPDYLSPFRDPETVVGEVTADPAGEVADCTSGVNARDCALATQRPNRLGAGGLEEGGLHGLLLDDDFDDNGIIYTFRSIPFTRHEVAPDLFWGEFHVSSFVMDETTNLIDPLSEEVLLEVPAEWDHCCHYAGDLDYLPDGTLTLTTGDDIAPESSGGYGPRDTRAPWLDGELTSANPADRRGKILRFREDGSVPDGSLPGEVPNPFIGMEGYNPYIDDTPGSPEEIFVNNEYTGDAIGIPGDHWIEFDPYVYSWGWKQPWRAVAMPNGDLYVSDVGPDAGADDPERGPAGLEEVNLVPFGGGTHHGWPRCAGPNIPYIDVDWTTLEAGDPLDCGADVPTARPIGTTEPTRRGMTGSPFYYPSAASPQWPIVGTGGKTSEPTFLYPGDVEGPLALPERYRDRLFVFEWSRNFILTIPYDTATGQLDLRNDVMDRVTPPQTTINPNTSRPQTSVSAQQLRLMSPADAAIGPDGAIYMVEYGAFFYAGENGRLSRIRAANAQPNPDANYGLPVVPADAAAAAAVPATASTPVLLGLGLGVVGTALARRRRRAIV
jgi:aldose sugar dehydrogenase